MKALKIYCREMAIKIMLVSIVVIIAFSAAAQNHNKPEDNASAEQGLAVLAASAASIDIHGLFEALRLPEYLIVDIRQSNVGDANLEPNWNSLRCDDKNKATIMEAMQTSTIVIVVGQSSDLSRVKTIADALSEQCGCPVYYYPEGLDSLAALANIFRNQ